MNEFEEEVMVKKTRSRTTKKPTTKVSSPAAVTPKSPIKAPVKKALDTAVATVTKNQKEAANDTATPVTPLIPSEANQVTLSPLTATTSTNKSRGKSANKALPGAVTSADSSKPLPLAEAALTENLAKKPAGSLQNPLRIFQYYHEAWQRDLLDPNFVAMNSGKNASEFQEFAIFEKLAKSDYVKGAQYWGALSWRFAESTGMGGADLIKYIKDHPGADVYFCNPYPHNEALFHNAWMQGETAHPHFLALCQGVFKIAGLPLDELTSITSPDVYSSCNYFVATPKFWTAYLNWVGGVISQANKKLPAKVRDLMHSAPAGEGAGAHPGATYVTFIIERLFPIFMKTVGKNFKGHKVPLHERTRELNVHLKLLREMKDMAHKTKSAWLAACWVNYRNLYCTQASGKTWCNKHLRNITPPEIKFS
jgi:hypothetical protein